jgi:hypothetical protein
MIGLLKRPWPEAIPERGALVLDSVHGHIRLGADEARDLCAAVELDRVWRSDLARLVTIRERYRRSWTWAELVDGAPGLQRTDARGEFTLGVVLERLGVVLVSIETEGAAR